MPLELTPEQAARLEQKVAEGLHPSPQAALEAALELLDEYDRKLAALRRDIQEGLDSGVVGPFDAEKIIARGRQRLAEERAKKKANASG